MKSLAKKRLDLLLVENDFFDSREKARRAVMAGKVRLGNGQRLEKPGALLPVDSKLKVVEGERYVSRGGLKLEGALKTFDIDPKGAICLDVGASTGGFTDCLLQHGAAKVYAIDVGTGQMAWKLRNDHRVVVREKINARFLQPNDFPDEIQIATLDLAFISLTLVLPPVLRLMQRGGQLLPLIKPQFELQRCDVGKGGIVREPELHRKAVDRIRAFALNSLDVKWAGETESSIRGTDGNREFFAWLQKQSGS